MNYDPTNSDRGGLQRPPPGTPESAAFVLDERSRRAWLEHQAFTGCERSQAHFFICQDLIVLLQAPVEVDATEEEISASLGPATKACLAAGHDHRVAGTMDCILAAHRRHYARLARRFDESLGVWGCMPDADRAPRPVCHTAPGDDGAAGATRQALRTGVVRQDFKQTQWVATGSGTNPNGAKRPHGYRTKAVGVAP